MSVTDPLDITRLLDEAVRLSRRHFRDVFLPVALPVAGAASVMSALQVGMSMQRPGEGGPSILGLAAFVVALLVYLLVYMGGYAAMQSAALDAAAGRRVDMGAAWMTLARPSVLLTWLLVGLGVFAGLLCCMLPGMYLGLLWAMAIPVVLEERLAYAAALARSGELMRHNPVGGLGNHPMLHAFLLFFVGGILSYALSTLISLPMMAIIAFAAFRAASSGQAGDADQAMQAVMWIQVPVQFASALVQIAVQVFVTMGMALLYFELRRRREGDDLVAAIDTVGAGAPPTAP